MSDFLSTFGIPYDELAMQQREAEESMTEKRATEITDCYNELAEANPEASTEWLLEMVSQECNCDNEQACEALVKTGVFTQ